MYITRDRKVTSTYFLTRMSDSEWFTSGFFFWTREPGNVFRAFSLFRRRAAVHGQASFSGGSGFYEKNGSRIAKVASASGSAGHTGGGYGRGAGGQVFVGGYDLGAFRSYPGV